MVGIYKKLDGVSQEPAPKVEFSKKTLTLHYDPDKLDEGKLVGALEGSRFKAMPIKKEEEKKE